MPAPIQTERLDATSGHRQAAESIRRAAEILRAGGTVAFPTETVYGLGANALSSTAVAQIFTAKQRPNWDPLIVHVSNPVMLQKIASVTRRAESLIAAFWPGPLTLLVERTSSIPDLVTAGRPLVGVRMPHHPLALALINAAQVPIAAPSANRFGHTSPTTAAHVLEDLDGRIDAILDGGPTTVGVESTVLDPATLTIYRPGAITAAMIEAALTDEDGGPVRTFHPAATAHTPESLPSPGVGIRHYAPRARLILVASEAELQTRITDLSPIEKLGVMLPANWSIPSGINVEIYSWQHWQDSAALAKTLFSGIRDLDARAVTVILCPMPPANGLGLAIRDRLEKAARTA
ncbi:MAG: Sua5/YciO/YrdC/YwlC family protein [Acidobacteriaceae bacterium]|nr:Sua5/YciO/YrdC/YwlC family protein [Acidobacteriaceae bacterium]